MSDGKRRLHSYLVTSDGRFFSCYGPEREAIVAEELASGGRVIMHWDFAPEETEREVSRFGDGVREGYEMAQADMRRSLGLQ